MNRLIRKLADRQRRKDEYREFIERLETPYELPDHLKPDMPDIPPHIRKLMDDFPGGVLSVSRDGQTISFSGRKGNSSVSVSQSVSSSKSRRKPGTGSGGPR